MIVSLRDGFEIIIVDSSQFSFIPKGFLNCQLSIVN